MIRLSIDKAIKISDDTNIAFTDIKKEPTNVFSIEFKKGNNIESNVNESEDEVKLEGHHVQAKIIEARVSSESCPTSCNERDLATYSKSFWNSVIRRYTYGTSRRMQ